jgi:AcrR family transcriptional regulator
VKRGRRPGRTETRDEILRVARSQFAERGYTRTTMRSIAERAGVHPALLHHYFKTKERLYEDALDVQIDPFGVLDRLLDDTPREEVPEALVRHFVSSWRHPATGPRLHALGRGIFDDASRADLLRSHWETVVIPRLTRDLAIPDANAAAALSALFGLTIADSLLRISPLNRLDEDALVALVAPALDRYLNPHDE